MTTETRRVFLETRAEDTLQVLLNRAAQAAANDELDSGGMLEIRPEGDARGLVIMAVFVEDGLRGTLAQLDVAVTREAGKLDPAVVLEAIQQFGGTQFVNLCVSAPRADDGARAFADDAIDVSVDFASGVPFVAKNVVLTRETLSSREAEAIPHCLRQLGVWHARHGQRFRVARYQPRRPPAAEAQARAYQAGVEADMTVALYSAPLPTKRSLRLAHHVDLVDGSPRRSLEICVSRGLRATEATTPQQVAAIERFLGRHFGLETAPGRYVVTSRRWAT